MAIIIRDRKLFSFLVLFHYFIRISLFFFHELFFEWFNWILGLLGPLYELVCRRPFYWEVSSRTEEVLYTTDWTVTVQKGYFIYFQSPSPLFKLCRAVFLSPPFDFSNYYPISFLAIIPPPLRSLRSLRSLLFSLPFPSCVSRFLPAKFASRFRSE